MRIHHRWIKIESIIQMSQFQNVPFCPISASPLSGIYASPRQAQILTRLRRINLERLNGWMPVPLYLSGVVNPAVAGSSSLILNPAVSGKHFETTS